MDSMVTLNSNLILLIPPVAVFDTVILDFKFQSDSINTGTSVPST